MKQVETNDLIWSSVHNRLFSKSLCDYQMSYSASELELLTILNAIEYWHYYLVGIPFIVITDHMPLKAFQKFDKASTRLFNWALKIELI